eukprot:g3738.t1
METRDKTMNNDDTESVVALVNNTRTIIDPETGESLLIKKVNGVLCCLDQTQMNEEVDWETCLCMGEQQRLAMARLFYHKPKFAILDECTSGVSASVERMLYVACENRGITCITISHRPVLKQYHDYVLNILKDGKGGWTWTKGGRGSDGESNASAKKNGDGSTPIEDTKKEDGYDEWGGVSQEYLTADDKSVGDSLIEKVRLEKRSEKYQSYMSQKRSKKINGRTGNSSTALSTSV